MKGSGFVRRDVFLPEPLEKGDMEPADEYPFKRQGEHDGYGGGDQVFMIGHRFLEHEEFVVKLDQEEDQGDAHDGDVLVMLGDAAPEESVFRGRFIR